MPGHGMVLTYGRRHQLRQVQADEEDSWDRIMGDKPPLQRVFSSSFSSNNDSSSKMLDSSPDGSAYLPSKSTRLRQCANSRKTSQNKGKENKCEKTLGKKRANRKGNASLFGSSDSSTSNGSDLDSSKPKPLRSHDANIKDTKRDMAKKAVKTIQVKKNTRAKQKELNRTSKSNIEASRRKENCHSQFAEFEEFNLYIEEEDPGRSITAKTLQNPTPLFISHHTPGCRPGSVEQKKLGMSTSTPHTQGPHQNLVQRLTRSNLKKMVDQQSTGSPIAYNMPSTAQESIQLLQENCSRTVESKASPIGGSSPACSHISGRVSLDSDLGDLGDVALDISEGSFQVPFPAQKLVTRRRQKHWTPNDTVFDMSDLCNFSPMLNKERLTPLQSAVGVHRSDRCTQSYAQSPAYATLQSQCTNSVITVPEEDVLSQCTQQLKELSLVNLEQSVENDSRGDAKTTCTALSGESRHCEASLEELKCSTVEVTPVTESKVVQGSTEADHSSVTKTPMCSEIPVQIRPCQVSLKRLKHPIEQVETLAPTKVAQLSVEPDYDASRSLFSDDGASPCCLRNHSVKRVPNSSAKEIDSVFTGPCHHLRNKPSPDYYEKEAQKVENDEEEPSLDSTHVGSDDGDDEDWVDTDEEDNEDDEILSDIVEEDSGKEGDSDADSDDDEDVNNKETSLAEDNDDENVEDVIAVSSDSEPSIEDSNTTRYTLANDCSSQMNKSETSGDSMYLTAVSVSQVSGELHLPTSQANTSRNDITPARKYLAERRLKELSLNSSTRNLEKVIEDLEISCHSLKCLTPVKSRMSGQEVHPRMKVLFHCDQDEEMSFNDCIPPAMMKKCLKIGEGVYGEVFRSVNRKESIALKIIPIEGSFPVNDEPQKTFAEILPEIVISKTLSDLNSTGDFKTPNFVQVKCCSLVKGSYPATLIKQWDTFHKKKGSENDRPDMFPRDQLFIVFEFENSGCDLEGFNFNSLQEAKSVFHQVALSMAIAEASLQFEHRDLHWGNVLVRRTQEQSLHYTLHGDDVELDSHGVQVAIIDFTLSRLTKDGCTVFTDLAQDPTMFEGEGDYQFDIYRKMQEENGNCWKPWRPHTNVLWMHYLADKLLYGKSYSSASSKEHKALSRQFRTLLRELTNYCSAKHVVTECTFFTD